MKNNLPITPLIRLENIQKSYRIEETSALVLNQVSLSIHTGEIVAILGPSGSGKSTLMNIIGLLDRAYEGHYWLRDQPTLTLDNDTLAHLRNRCIGFVFQQFHLLPRLTALQNVALPLHYRNLPNNIIEQEAYHALEHVGMQTFAHRKPPQLSGGQQQRVAIARALIGNPDVILADEPTGALDSRTSNDIMTLFLTLHQEGRTLILITHEEQIAAQCRRRITLSDGHIISDTQA